MKKALITGSLGFVGQYLREELEQNGYEVLGLDLRPGEKTRCVDLLKGDQLISVLEEYRPQVLFHLAGQADVGRSWREPGLTMRLNVEAAANLLEAVRLVDPKIRVLMVGSSDQYGNLGSCGENVTEDLVMDPRSPYAVSKKAQEELSRLYARAYGMNICMTRSFNHGGVGQRPGFMIPDFASGIVAVERGLKDSLAVGNLTARRDFTHVRDVVRAYRLIMEKGRPGEVYNVGSGTTYSAEEILKMMLELAKVPVPVRQDPARMRPSDTPVICCNHEKLTADTGWEPEYTVPDMVRDVLNDFRGR